MDFCITGSPAEVNSTIETPIYDLELAVITRRLLMIIHTSFLEAFGDHRH